MSLRPGAITLDFQLAADPLNLEEIVVTGLGQTIRRQRLGVAISSIRGEDLTRLPTPNLVRALSGRAPGVQVTSSSGDAGASALVLIRGVKTIEGSSQPLIVVDGMPVDNSESLIPASVQYGVDTYLGGTPSPNRAIDINPADIASVEVLKGPAAGAVYGARAASGVILITTRSGRPGTTRATLTTSATLDQVSKQYPLQRRFAQGNLGVTSTASLFSWGVEITGPSHDHFGELFEDGRALDADLSISGGNDRTAYYLSLGYSDHDGIVVGDNDYYTRWSGRLKASHRLTDDLQISANVAVTQSEGSFVQKGSNRSGLLLAGLRTPPSLDNRPYLTPEGFHRSYTIP